MLVPARGKFRKRTHSCRRGFRGESFFEQEKGLLPKGSLEGKLTVGDVVKGLMHKATLHANMIQIIEGSFSK